MNIALLADVASNSLDGVAVSLNNLKKGLEKEGHTVFTATAEKFKPSFPVPRYPNYKVALPFGIAKQLDYFSPDVVHIHTYFVLGQAGYKYALRNSAKLVSTYHTPVVELIENSGYEIPFPFWRTVYRKFEGRVVMNSEPVIVPSNYMAQHLQKLYEGAITNVIPNGIDTNYLKPASEEKVIQFKEKFRINTSNKTVGVISRISKEKKIDDLINSTKYLDGFTVCIAGVGPTKQKYELLAKEAIKKGADIKFLGAVEDVDKPVFLSMLDCYVASSRVETQGLGIIEAMACKTPAVTVNSWALTENVQEGKTGYLYEPENIKQLAENIQRAINLKPEKCREFVVENRSIDKSIEETLGAYNS